VQRMSEPTPGQLSDPERFRRWKPDAQQRALGLIREAENRQWRPFYCRDGGCNGQPHVLPADPAKVCTSPLGYHLWGKDTTWVCTECGIGGTGIDEWGFPHARQDQRPPKWTADWMTLLLRGGRGSGKTRTGAEITNRVPEKFGRIILIAATGPDFRDTMVEGESGILATSPPGKRPLWEPSKKRLTWPNGAIAQGFSAEEPDRLRGPQSGFVWADEPAHWPLVEECWENMLYGLRLRGAGGLQPRIAATSTPKPTKWMKALVAKKKTVDRVVSTYANIANLAETYRENVIEPREGTRMGRQELFGEILEDVEGALWNWDMIANIEEAPALQRIVVSVDPAGTANKKSDETGIIVLGIGHDKRIYVLADLTGKFSPEQWGRKVWAAVDDYSADAIVYEKNYGGEMVAHVLETTQPNSLNARLIPVTSRRGKDIRAEPIVALYEKKKVLHVGKRGDLQALEDEQTTWVPHEGPSPNRVDALVHGATELGKHVMPAAIASPKDLAARYRHTQPRHLRAV
jgi:phage terminase large subunit-like protein